MFGSAITVYLHGNRQAKSNIRRKLLYRHQLLSSPLMVMLSRNINENEICAQCICHSNKSFFLKVKDHLVCLSVLSVWLFVCLSVSLSVCLFLGLSVRFSVYLFVCLTVCLTLCLFVCLSVCLCICMFICLTICLFVSWSVCVCLFVLCQIVCLFVY